MQESAACTTSVLDTIFINRCDYFQPKNYIMKQYFNNMNNLKTLLAFSLTIIFLVSCNKDMEQMGDIQQPQRSGETLDQILRNNPNDSLYYRLMIKGGQTAMIADSNRSFTLFVPGNNAMKKFITAISGGVVVPVLPDAVFSQFITNFITTEQAAALVQYNTMPQIIKSSSIPSTFPNFFYPSVFNPAPNLSSLFRLNLYPSTINGAWLNNLPLTSVNTVAYNGVIHHCAGLAIPPQRYLWDRINTDTGLTYLKAAIARADSGTAAPGFLQGVLGNIGANLTVFAPTNEAFQTTLKGLIAQTLINQGVPLQIAIAQATALSSTPDVFSNSMLFSVLTAEKVKGILVYHLLGSRAFTNNFPTSTTTVYTLLKLPGMQNGLPLTLKAKFGTPFVDSAIVKGLGNSTPANIIINSTPLTADPDGTSDQLYLNGILHKIDGILMPQ